MKNLSPQPTTNSSPKLLDRARGILRAKHYSLKTEQSYINWMKRYILFYNKRHPRDMGEHEISRFLTHLAVQENVAASTQNQALCAIVFLYKYIIKMDQLLQAALWRTGKSAQIYWPLYASRGHIQ